MNLKLGKLSLSNFLSFGKKETVVDLAVEHNCLIVGNNMDIGSPGESRNGVGKTTVFQGILFALYGKGIDKIKADEFVNLKNEKKLVVQLEFSVNGVDYRIVRGRKPSFLHFFKGDEDLTLDSMSNTDKVITDVIGVSYEVFMGVYFLSPHRDQFMAMSGPDQRKFVESVLQLDTLAERADALKKMNRDQVQVDLKLVARDIASAEDVNRRVNENVTRLSSLRDKFDQDQKARIDDLVDLIAIEDDIDFDEAISHIEAIPDISHERSSIQNAIGKSRNDSSRCENEIRSLKRAYKNMAGIEQSNTTFDDEKRADVEAKEAALSKFETEEYYHAQNDLAQRRNALRQETQQLNPEIRMLERQLDSLESDLDKSVTEIEKLSGGECPFCGTKDHGHKLVAKLDSMEQGVETKLKKQESLHAEWHKLTNRLTEIAAEIAELDSQIVVDDPHRLISARNQAQHALIVAEKAENPYIEQLTELRNEYTSPDHINGQIRDFEFEKENADMEVVRLTNLLAEKEKSYQEAVADCEDSYGTVDAEELKTIRNDVERAKQDLAVEQAKENPYIVEIGEAQKQFINIDELTEQARELEKKEQHIKYLIKMLTDSKSFVRKNIVDQYVPFLNKRINEYCDRMGLGHTFEINTDLSVDITYMQKSVSYYLMSQGERMRLNTATTMAFRDLMSMLGKNCNVMLIDEMFDNSLDASGCHDMIKFVNGFAENVMLVSHREEFDAYMNRKMIVTKQNGFSSIEFTD